VGAVLRRVAIGGASRPPKPDVVNFCPAGHHEARTSFDWGDVMLKCVVLSAVVFGGLIAGDLTASAQQSPRQRCCIEMGGQWGNASQGRGGSTYCYGMGRGTRDAYYKCVEEKTFGKKKK
jgi:hypothetical protein